MILQFHQRCLCWIFILGLKSVQEQKAEEKKNRQEANLAKASTGGGGGGGGDLMSDLANKLAMRRKGISGDS